MISRVAVLPHPPLLVPELLGGGDAEADAVRAACLAVAGELAACSPSWTAVGVGASPPSGVGTFAPFGVDVRVTLRDEDGAPDPGWPLSALIAGWLRGQVGAREVDLRTVAPDLSPDACAERGRELIGATALLVLGDGSHRHGPRSVGRPDERAAAFDGRVARALADADPHALLALDPAEAAELGAVGRAPWQVLAGAVLADGRRWRSTRAQALTPFGVAYHLAVWEPV
ncbi:class III extradiol dioxygenase subunit B-like domain-containing protein [Actinokineospora guangxiensis]|uniref:Class III extradiol dioxygenase subunit B-like domain-containing protein n=1 Tax=Actinokineospora guangxiensis TaxID=1490288 RepID=A0ABW0EN49_9PSEU